MATSFDGSPKRCAFCLYRLGAGTGERRWFEGSVAATASPGLRSIAPAPDPRRAILVESNVNQNCEFLQCCDTRRSIWK